jgi:cobalt/nickel transport system permease protein
MNMLTLWTGLALAILFSGIAGIIKLRLIRRMMGFNGFLLFMFLVLPLSFPGTPVFHIGPLTWSWEGMLKSVSIAVKANTIMLVFTALIATIEPVTLSGALNALGCPEKLTHLLFFVVRYVESIQKELTRLTNAMKLRCFRPAFSRHTFRSYGYLIGMLLVKSLDRSERILEAMKCRGFQNRFYTLTTFQFTNADTIFLTCWICLLVGLGVIEWI